MQHAQHADGAAPIRRTPSNKFSFTGTTLFLASVITSLMLGVGLPNIVSGDGIMMMVKCALLAAGGMTVSYAVNRLAVERGAPLVVKGYGWAGVVSSLSILIVGGGLFSATYSGLTYQDVEQLRIEAHGEALGSFVSQRSAAAAQSSGMLAAINAVVSDLTQKRDCEIIESCISGHAGGGNGPVARTLNEKLGTAVALAQQVENGEAARQRTIEQLNRLYSEYEAIASGDLSADEKRRALRGLDLSIRQAVADLDSALPVVLLGAYGEELRGSVEIEGRPDAARRITAILRPHGQAIAGLVRALPERGDMAPAFPKQTGVSDTFAYIGHFLPIAAIAAVVELVFPICLWLYTLFALSWADWRVSPTAPRPLHPDDEALQHLFSGPSGYAGNPPLSPIDHRRERRGYRRPHSFTNGYRPDSGR